MQVNYGLWPEQRCNLILLYLNYHPTVHPGYLLLRSPEAVPRLPVYGLPICHNRSLETYQDF
jgi:hypothetical protein